METKQRGLGGLEELTLQWGHAFVSVETTLDAIYAALIDDVASMGPRFCKRGNKLLRRHTPLSANASMGPRFCKRGNAGGLDDLDHAALASMGPRFCKRGNGCTPRMALSALQLQWGHAFVSVETDVFIRIEPQNDALQWGHAFVSVETSFPYQRGVAINRLRWGHAFVSVET